MAPSQTVSHNRRTCSLACPWLPICVATLCSRANGSVCRVNDLRMQMPCGVVPHESDEQSVTHGAAALERDMAVMMHFDFHLAWKKRPVLWNWFDPDKPGYDPDNQYNVERHGWDGPPNKARYLNWSLLERVAPNMCFTSKETRAEVTRLVSEIIGPVLREEIAKLEAEGRARVCLQTSKRQRNPVSRGR